MNRIVRVAALEIRKKGFLKYLMISMISLACILFLTHFKFKELQVTYSMLRLIPYVLLVVYSFSLTQEFQNKTDKIVFTGIFTRNEIVISKLISFIGASSICFVFYEITSIIYKTFNYKSLFNDFLVFIVYSFTLGSFVLLVSIITSRFIVTGIVSYILYFDLMLTLMEQAMASHRGEFLKGIIRNLPFYTANGGFYKMNYTVNNFIVMISSGILFLILACVIINRKNI